MGRSAGFDTSRYALSDAENGEAAPLATQEGPGSPTHRGALGHPQGGHLLVSAAAASCSAVTILVMHRRH